MDNHPGGEYNFLGTQVTSQGGRINFKIPEKFGTGLYPVRCQVRGDKSTAEGFMAVVPNGTECVVFSIDGSFTLNMSLMGRDAKIRPGAVEVSFFPCCFFRIKECTLFTYLYLSFHDHPCSECSTYYDFRGMIKKVENIND